MSEIYFLREKLKEKNDLIKSLLNKTDLSKQEGNIQNNETSKEVHSLLAVHNEELIINVSIGAEIDITDNSSENNNSGTKENLFYLFISFILEIKIQFKKIYIQV